jgi:hypothetical protein
MWVWPVVDEALPMPTPSVTLIVFHSLIKMPDAAKLDMPVPVPEHTIVSTSIHDVAVSVDTFLTPIDPVGTVIVLNLRWELSATVKPVVVAAIVALGANIST